MSPKVVIVTLSIVGLLSLGIGWSLWEDSAPVSQKSHSSFPKKVVQQCPQLPSSWSWKPGVQYVYDYALDAETTFRSAGLFGTKALPQQDQQKKQVMSFVGQLNFRVFEKRNDRVYVGLQFSPLEIQVLGMPIVHDALQQLYQSFFLAVITPDGHFKEFLFPPQLAIEDQQALLALVKPLQVVLPTIESAKGFQEWVSMEIDHTGDYEAHYNADARDCGLIHKTKVYYSEIQSTHPSAPKVKSIGSMTADIQESMIEARVASELSWLASFSGNETLLFELNGEMISSSKTQLDLMFRSKKINSQLDIGKETRDLETLLLAFQSNVKTASPKKMATSQFKPQPTSQSITQSSSRTVTYLPPQKGYLATVRQEAQRSQLQRLDPEQLLDQLVQTTVSQASLEGSHLLRGKLTEYLKAFPEKSIQFAQWLQQLPQDTSAKDQVSGAIMTILVEADTPEAQQAITTLATDELLWAMARLQAVTIAADFSNPSPELLDMLWSIADAPPDSSSKASLNRPGSALLALGIASYRLSEQQRFNDSHHIKAQLTERLAKSSNISTQALILESLGNASDEALLPAIEPYLESSSSAVRESAMRALRRLPPHTTTHLVVNRFEAEPVAYVRKAALQNLMRHKNEEAIAAIQQSLSKEKDEGLRQKMIQFLGSQKAQYPQVTSTLKTQLELESSDSLKKVIYRALYE